jgi:hypothetical protein
MNRPDPSRTATVVAESRVAVPGAERRIAFVPAETRVAVARPRGGRIDG